MLAPLNEAAPDTLTRALEAKGYAVDRVDAYRMVPTDDPAPDGLADADAVLFTASSQVDGFVERFGSESIPPLVACIGPATAATAAAHQMMAIVQPATPNIAGLIEVVVGSLRSDEPEKRIL